MAIVKGYTNKCIITINYYLLFNHVSQIKKHALLLCLYYPDTATEMRVQPTCMQTFRSVKGTREIHTTHGDFGGAAEISSSGGRTNQQHNH